MFWVLDVECEPKGTHLKLVLFYNLIPVGYKNQL